MTGISSTQIADRPVSPHFLDGWPCNDVATDDTVVAPYLVTGDQLLLNGTLTGLGATPGRLTFNGTDQWLQAASAGTHALKDEESALISLRLNSNAGAASDVIMHSAGTDNNLPGYKVQILGSGALAVHIGDANNGSTILATGTDGIDHHVVVAFEVDNFRRGYLDGSIVYNGTSDVGSAQPTSDRKLTVGSRVDGLNNYDGAAWDIQIYKVSGALPANYEQIVTWLNTHPYQLLPASIWS